MKKIDCANDRDPNVKVEIEAARLELANGPLVGFRRFGYDAHAGGLEHYLRRSKAVRAWLAGWLTRELRSHDDHRESRDREAWPWDPSRPVAGQYEEFLAEAERKYGATITEQTRHDIAASVARHAATPRTPDERVIAGLERMYEDVEPPEGYQSKVLERIDHETARAADPDLRDEDPCDDLVAFADGELETARANEFRVHLVTCEPCRTELVEHNQVLGRLSELGEDQAYADAALEDATSEAIVEQAERATGGGS